MKIFFAILAFSVTVIDAISSCPAGKYNSAGSSSCFGIYKERESGQCGDSGGGWGKITSSAACGEAAAAVGWSDTTATTLTTNMNDFPPGCYYINGWVRNQYLYFNEQNPNYDCLSDEKCVCTLTCPPGTFQDEPGQSSCKTCASGTFQEQAGQSSCKDCTSDTYSDAGASSCLFDATSCPVGTYASGTAACLSCGSGKYNDQTGQTSDSSCKTDCSAGSYIVADKGACLSCPVARYSNDDASSCFDVGVYKKRVSGECGDSGGGWSKITSKAACEEAAAAVGWSDTTASTNQYGGLPPGCSLWFGGLYFNQQNTNVACSSNEKCACTLTCPPGTFQDQSGQSSCKTCTSGTYSDTGASSCLLDATSCPVGTHASGTLTVCDFCASGKYNDQTGQTSESSCKECDSGLYQNEAGQFLCKTCTSPLVGVSTRCIDNTVNGSACPPGTYQDQPNQTSCKDCTSGDFQDQSGQTSCKNCPDMMWTESNKGQSACVVNLDSVCGTGTTLIDDKCEIATNTTEDCGKLKTIYSEGGCNTCN